MLDKFRQRAQEEKGFTLVELLVVMLILGILAAIAVPSFLSQQEKAKDSDAKAAARTAETAAETFLTDSTTSDYTGIGPAALVTIESTLTDATNLAAVTPGTGPGAGGLTAGDSYTVSADSEDDRTFSITRYDNGTTTRNCDTPSTGGCRADGTW